MVFIELENRGLRELLKISGILYFEIIGNEEKVLFDGQLDGQEIFVD